MTVAVVGNMKNTATPTRETLTVWAHFQCILQSTAVMLPSLGWLHTDSVKTKGD